jgi:hypothetical protein
MIFLASLAALVFASAPQSASGLSAVLHASGAKGGEEPWLLSGTATVQGVKQPFQLQFDNAGRWHMSTLGVLIGNDGFDGDDAWTTNLTGTSHRNNLDTADLEQLQELVLSGRWALESSLHTEQGATPGSWLLTPRGSPEAGNLTLDPQTNLPKTLTFWSGGIQECQFGEYKQFGDRTFPTHLYCHIGHLSADIEIADAKHVTNDDAAYAMPAPKPNWDDSAKSTIKFLRVAFSYEGGDGQYMFVQPQINGEDAGYFLLDSGYDSLLVDAQFAKKAKLTSVATGTTVGVVATQSVDINKGQSASLGPIRMDNPVFTNFDLGWMNNLFHLTVSGICGNDFLSRAIYDIDPVAGEAKIMRPDSIVPDEGIVWVPVLFSGDTPCLKGGFEGHQGYFSIDTGSNATVIFSPTGVNKYSMLANHETRETSTTGVGGGQASRLGKIDYFELAGHRFSDQSAAFQTGTMGSYGNPYLVGSIGMGLLKKCRLILDYPHNRIGFKF